MVTCTECRQPVLTEALRVELTANRRGYLLRTRCCDALLMAGPISDLDPLYARGLTEEVPESADSESAVDPANGDFSRRLPESNRWKVPDRLAQPCGSVDNDDPRPQFVTAQDAA